MKTLMWAVSRCDGRVTASRSPTVTFTSLHPQEHRRLHWPGGVWRHPPSHRRTSCRRRYRRDVRGSRQQQRWKDWFWWWDLSTPVDRQTSSMESVILGEWQRSFSYNLTGRQKTIKSAWPFKISPDVLLTMWQLLSCRGADCFNLRHMDREIPDAVCRFGYFYMCVIFITWYATPPAATCLPRGPNTQTNQCR